MLLVEDSLSKKSRNHIETQVLPLEEPLALLFAHGVAEIEGAHKKKKYGPKKKRETLELGGKIGLKDLEGCTTTAGATSQYLPPP